jgi:hypothetical protein
MNRIIQIASIMRMNIMINLLISYLITIYIYTMLYMLFSIVLL